MFPSERSLLRLVGAVLAEQDDIWAGKRYFPEERIAELSKERKPSLSPAPERLEELRETARRAIDASLELADGMETAWDSIQRDRFRTASLPGQNGPLHQLSRHYRAEQRKLAIETYIKFDLSAAGTVAELGCPTRHSLRAWYKDYLEHGGCQDKGRPGLQELHAGTQGLGSASSVG